jgi:hypothetical protein
MSRNKLTGYSESSAMPQRVRDVLGRLKVAIHQNIYDADFEYGTQPLRWEALTTSGATVTHQPGKGGVKMSVTTASGDICIRQSRPYHRYQPGKSMFMATACQVGAPLTNNVTRVGFFDDGNGAFFEQSTATATNPYGMAVVIRSDSNGLPTDTRFTLDQWNGDSRVISQLDFTRIQMFWIEYAWYGAGATRFGFWIDGEPVIAHQVGWGNYISPTGVANTQPWARTGNLPVRYEQRNTGTIAQANDLFHYGVSVLVEGGQDDQRGFTYSYGMDPIIPVRAVAMAASSPVRKPVLSIRSKAMGLVEYSQASTGTGIAGTTGSTTGTVTGGSTTTLVVGAAAWVVDYWKGRYVYLQGLAGQGGTGSIARIVSNTATTLTLVDNVTGGALGASAASVTNYSIGLLNRGQLLPKKLYVVQTTASVNCTIEIVASTPGNPVVLAGASFVGLSGIGSPNSFAERDVSATAITGGEVTFAFPLNAGAGIQEIDLSYFFPMLNTIRGNQVDILTVSIAGPANTAYTVGASLICQEAMS